MTTALNTMWEKIISGIKNFIWQLFIAVCCSLLIAVAELKFDISKHVFAEDNIYYDIVQNKNISPTLFFDSEGLVIEPDSAHVKDVCDIVPSPIYEVLLHNFANPEKPGRIPSKEWFYIECRQQSLANTKTPFFDQCLGYGSEATQEPDIYSRHLPDVVRQEHNQDVEISLKKRGRHYFTGDKQGLTCELLTNNSSGNGALISRISDYQPARNIANGVITMLIFLILGICGYDFFQRAGSDQSQETKPAESA